MTALSNLRYTTRINYALGERGEATHFLPAMTAEDISKRIVELLMRESYARWRGPLEIKIEEVPGQEPPERVDMGRKFGITNHV